MNPIILFIISLILIIFKVVAAADETCTTTDLQNIESCYQKYAPDGYQLFFQKRQSQFGTSQIINNWYNPCRSKKNLNKCLGNIVVQRCFNIANMSTLPFLNNSTDAAKVIISDFLKIDYVCQKIFNFTDNDAICLSEKLPKSIDKICKRNYSSCETINAFSSCIKKLAYKKCRKYVGCFVQKTAMLETCEFSSCGDCATINANKNPIENLCNDDKSNNTIFYL
uniref:Uncharacterized protein n=1 Tax=Panagrolaimus superbus TaxID=310955 RepID=A0A914Z915_9BILA